MKNEEERRERSPRKEGGKGEKDNIQLIGSWRAMEAKR